MSRSLKILLIGLVVPLVLVAMSFSALALGAPVWVAVIPFFLVSPIVFHLGKHLFPD
jgi:hypothetical protein